MSTAERDLGSSSSSGPTDVHRIELEIEATREELDRTLHALQRRFSPRQRLREAMQNARDRGSRLAGRGGELARDAAGLVRREPLPFVVGAVGVIAIFAARMVMRRRRW